MKVVIPVMITPKDFKEPITFKIVLIGELLILFLNWLALMPKATYAHMETSPKLKE